MQGRLLWNVQRSIPVLAKNLVFSKGCGDHIFKIKLCAPSGVISTKFRFKVYTKILKWAFWHNNDGSRFRDWGWATFERKGRDLSDHFFERTPILPSRWTSTKFVPEVAGKCLYVHLIVQFWKQYRTLNDTICANVLGSVSRKLGLGSVAEAL